jgi:multicomponent Na+:H+ antiporter subunit D
MESITSISPLLAVLVSAVGALLIIALKNRPNLRELCSVAAGIVKLSLVISMIPVVLRGSTIECTVFKLLPGIDIAFRVDALGLLFALGASLLWIVTTFYSIGYMRSLDEHAQTRYYACFAVALSCTMGVAFAANLFTLFLFYEGLTLSTYPLVAHKETPEARAGGRKYIIYLLGAAKVFLLTAIILTYNLTGTLDFSAGGVFSEGVQAAQPGLLSILFLLFLFGFAKCAVMPLHGWLPAAMVAPTPVSALLHAVAVVKTGVFAVVRITLFVFGIDCLRTIGVGGVFVALASFTIITASVIALTRDNLKARLAFSTVSQLSYILLGAALLAPSALVGGIIHITFHAVSKITLFFCAGSIYVSSHLTEVSQLGGIGKKMPWTMAAFAVATLSMIGVPPACGFVSKWYLVVGALERDSLVVLTILMFSSLLNAAYFVPIVYRAFFGEEGPVEGEAAEVKEVPLIVVPLVLTAAGSIILGLFPEFFIKLAEGVLG